MSSCANPPSKYNPKLVLESDARSSPFGDCDAPRVLCSEEIAAAAKNMAFGLTVIPRFRVIYPDDTFIPVMDQFNLNAPIKLNAFHLQGLLSDKDCAYIVSSSAWLESIYKALVSLQANIEGIAISPIDGTDVLSLLNAVFTSEQTCLPNNLAVNALPLSKLFDIYIEKYDVNRCGKAYVYRVNLVGTDLETGIALYSLNKDDAWNRCVPKEDTWNRLLLGDTTTYAKGSPVHIVGVWDGVPPASFSSGVVSNNISFQTNGIIGYEGISTTAPVGAGATGAPILNQCGYVVGMVTGADAQGNAFGVSTKFLHRVLREIIEEWRHPGCSRNVVFVPLFGFLVYRHGSLGIKFKVVTATDIGLLLPENDEVPTSFPILQGGCNGHRRCSENRELIGLLVTDTSGMACDAYAVDYCGNDAGNVLEPGDPVDPCDCPVTRLEPGDFITYIGNEALGQLPNQILPDVLLYSLTCGDQVVVNFLKQSDDYSKNYCMCVTLKDSLQWYSDMDTEVPVIPEDPTPLDLAPVFAYYMPFALHLMPAVELNTQVEQQLDVTDPTSPLWPLRAALEKGIRTRLAYQAYNATAVLAALTNL